MKKTLSVLLAVIMVALLAVPAFAADTHTVEFVAPSTTLETVTTYNEDGTQKGIIQAYSYLKVIDGSVDYHEDSEGEYVYFNSRYMPISNVIEPDQYNFTTFYSPTEWDASQEVEDGETVSFIVTTNEVYNAETVSVYVNGTKITADTDGVYKVYCDRNLQISVNDSEDVLLRNMFTVTMPSDTGYSVKTLEGENYKLVPYGGDFTFRVKISKGYTDSGMTVKVIRGSSGLDEYIGENADSMFAFLPAGTTDGMGVSIEQLSSTGVDNNGYRIYTIKNITQDSKIIVSGVTEESKSGFMAILKRILKLILDFFGIKSDLFASVTNTYSVTINAPEDSQKVTYSVTSGYSGDEIAPSNFDVASGDSITIQLATSYAECDKHVEMVWTFTDDDGNIVDTGKAADYNSSWNAKRNASTGAVYYTKLVVIDNITNNLKITITEK